MLEKLGELLRRAHFGQPVLAALFGGFDGDVLPFGLLLRGALVIDLDDGAIGHDGRDFGSADLNGFLHDEVHVFPFREWPEQGDAAGKRTASRFVQSAETNLGAIDGDDLGGNLAAVAVEEDKLCAGLEPENIARVMGFAAAQHGRVGIPFVRRDVEAMHAN